MLPTLQVALELQQKGGRAIAIKADVSKKADCDRMVQQAAEALGGLHIAINNAGINKNSAAEETPEDEWEATFAVNTKGVFLSCQVGKARLTRLCLEASFPYILEAGFGKISYTASMV